MPVKRNMRTVERPAFTDANGTQIPAKTPWVVSQSTLDKVLTHMQTATGLTVFELCKRTNPKCDACPLNSWCAYFHGALRGRSAAAAGRGSRR